MTEELKEEIRQIIRDEIVNHLQIEIDSYYEPYSEQQEHYHKVNLQFKED